MKSKTRLFEAALVLFAILLATQGEAVTFQISDDKKTWDDADDYCKKQGDFLAIVDTEQKRTQLKKQLNDDHKHYWIGLKIDSKGIKLWANGSELKDSIKIDQWGKGDKNCVVFKKKKKKKPNQNEYEYEFKAKKCKEKHENVCQDDSDSPKSQGNTMVHDFHTFMETLNASDPGSMEKLLKKFDDVMGAIDPTIMTEEDFNPLLEAHSIETFAMAYTKMHLNSNKTSMKLDSEIIAYQAKVVHRSTNSNVILAPDDEDTNRNFITMPKELFQNEEEVIVVGVVFKNDKNNTLRRLTPKIFKGIPNSARLNTKIVSLSTYPKLKEPFEDNILFTLQHIQVNATNNPLEVHCSFWNFSIPTSHNGSWSERGCRVKSTTDTYTVCECNHMTNFAVLMQLKPEKKIAKKHQIALTAITYVGLVLSLVGEAVTVLCYCIFLNVHNVKIQIRINLLCALAGAQIVMLGGIAQTEHKGVCVLVAALIHYLYLASFCWMFMEAVYLHRLVVKVFDVGLKMRIFYLLAYGCPGVMVLLAVLLAEMCTGGIYTYCNPHYCWVNFKNKLIWSFVAPVLLIVTTNSVLLFCVIKEMFSMKTVKTIGSAELSMIRASVRACVVLLPLLGITWVFGLLSLADIGIAWQYIFTILNATQGFMIFIFHCVRNSELKAAISLRIHQWESNNSNNHSKGRVTPTKLNRETKSSQESPRGSVPMVTAITNKVMPENTI